MNFSEENKAREKRNTLSYLLPRLMTCITPIIVLFRQPSYLADIKFVCSHMVELLLFFNPCSWDSLKEHDGSGGGGEARTAVSKMQWMCLCGSTLVVLRQVQADGNQQWQPCERGQSWFLRGFLILPSTLKMRVCMLKLPYETALTCGAAWHKHST